MKPEDLQIGTRIAVDFAYDTRNGEIYAITDNRYAIQLYGPLDEKDGPKLIDDFEGLQRRQCVVLPPKPNIPQAVYSECARKEISGWWIFWGLFGWVLAGIVFACNIFK